VEGKRGRFGLAWVTVSNHQERISRLCEQGADETRIGEYVRRWWIWAKGGVPEFSCGLSWEWVRQRAEERLGVVLSSV